MIVIDGQQSDLKINNFTNLEEVLVKIMEGNYLEDRVVTDVYINEESFSEIYPHQSEDIETGEISKIEIHSTPVSEMAFSIIEELMKVIRIMDMGSRRVADLFRQADDSEALEMYQDLIDVIRDFLGMVGVLREEFKLADNPVLLQATEELSELFSEMLEVVENEDWILLSDLLEYEFIPAVKNWNEVLTKLRGEIQDA